MTKKNRPAGVTFLALLVFFISASNLVRLVLSIQEFGFYTEILPFDPVYLTLSGIVWVVLGFPLVFGLWFGTIWAPIFCRVATIGYTSYFWLEYILLVHPQKAATNLVFLIVANSIIIVWIFWLLSRAQVKSFFGVNDE